MNGPLALGARLALGAPGQRFRSGLVAVAALVGSAVLLAVLAVAAAERSTGSAAYGVSELQRLTLAVVVAVALPVMVLAATVGRLSASVRDRRLANLRLLGLSPTQTRLVAAAEAGTAALPGSLAGALVFAVALRPLLAAVPVAGRSYDVALLQPGALGWLLAVLGVPAVTVAVASLPHRYDARATLDRARRRDQRRPSPLRAVPLAIGLVLCLVSSSRPSTTPVSGTWIGLFFAAVVVTGLGVVLVVPVFVRLLADAMLRLSRGPATLVAARRLQAQPAAVTRVVSALMIGLFLVMGARCVVAAFESTPQYVDAAYSEEVEQHVTTLAGPRSAERLVSRAAATRGVTGAVALPSLSGNRGSTFERRKQGEVQAVVATCAQLREVLSGLRGCVDGQVMALGRWTTVRGPVVLAGDTDLDRGQTPPTVSLDLRPTSVLSLPGVQDVATTSGIQAGIVLPPSTPGLARVVAEAPRTVVIAGAPGDDLGWRISASGEAAYSVADFTNYEFVAGLRTIVWSVASVILGVGLLTFAIAGIDRALTRRREIASLQVVGTSPGLLRRAQWLEAALPTTTGCLLAVAAGLLAGRTYLSLDDGTPYFPWSAALGLSAAALVASVAVAGLTVVATGARTRPEHLRTE